MSCETLGYLKNSGEESQSVKVMIPLELAQYIYTLIEQNLQLRTTYLLYNSSSFIVLRRMPSSVSSKIFQFKFTY